MICKKTGISTIGVVFACVALFSACGGSEETCEPGSCSGHGTCDDTSGEAICTCDTAYAGEDCSVCASGYQDNDNDGFCKMDCTTADLDCGDNGHCEDSSGTAGCYCDTGYEGEDCDSCAAGYQDYDANGTCEPKCSTAGLDCGHGECYDVSGTPVCVCDEGYTGSSCSVCDEGYQDNDTDGICLPDCASAGLECGANGSCDDSGGIAVCACDTGYAGEACDTCAVGYQDNDDNGTCLADCDTAGLGCSGHGTCDDSGGEAVCMCELGYTGDDCSECNVGYQDNDDDGTCEMDCANARPDCTENGHCDDSSGTAVCVCDTGYTGDNCNICDTGYQDNDSNGTCLPDCAHAGFSCGDHGDCEDESGTAVCVCDTGYAGDLCDTCDTYYQDNDGDGICAEGCVIAGLDCGTYGLCNDESGTAVCECMEGYTGDGCLTCDSGYQDNDDNGTCHADCDTANLGCVHGSCDDESGQAVCVCVDETWSGELCDTCAPGYQDNDDNETCEPNCASAGLSCGLHAHCDDSGGTAVCVCDTGYTGADCDVCDAGYQDNDDNGTCRPDCETIGYDVTCTEGDNGYCDDSGGTAICICDMGYTYDGMGHCTDATGYDCASAMPLAVANDVIEDTTVGSGNDYDPGCTSYSDAEEMVYSFVVDVPVHIKFTTEGFDTVIYVRSDCENAGSEMLCDDQSGPGSGSMVEADFEEGTYYLFVDGWSSYAGSYTLTVEISCPPGQIFDPDSQTCVDDPCLDPNPCTDPHKTVCEPIPPTSWVCHCDPGYIDDPANPGTCIPDPNPQGESCADAKPLPVVSDGYEADSTLDAEDDGSSTSCGGNGPDRVYGVVFSEETRVELLMAGYDTVLHMRTECDNQASEVICNDQFEGNHAGFTTIVEPGTYYIWADSWYDTGGDYELFYSFRANPCADEEAACPGTPVCQAWSDWSGFDCICPEGTLPWQGDCVDDPCIPNECSEPNKNVCEPDLPGAYDCYCNPGYIDDPENPGTCIEDPDANEWAFIVYLNADSNLDPAGWDDVAEMGVAGSSYQVHIVALFDTAGYEDDGHARKIYITEGGYDVIEDMGEIDMGDWQTMRDFGIWAVQNYPARHYAFIMWDHGSGWEKNPPLPYKGFSYDYNSGNNISISNGDYAAALEGITDVLGDKLDIVGHDECLMQMWEVAAASAPYAHYIVASEQTEPFDGWPYDGFLPGLVADPLNTTPLDLVTAIVDAYHDADSSNDTLSAIDLDTMGDLNAAITNFADALMDHPDLYSQVEDVRSDARYFSDWDFRDLKGVAIGVAAMSGVPGDLQAAANALVDQLDITIAHNQSYYSDAYGMSIYFPSQGSAVDSAYTDSGAVWSQQTTWDEFLQDF